MKVPTTEPSRQTAPTTSGKSMSEACASPTKKMWPSSMVATTVTQ